MLINEWLRRINLEKYTIKCYELGIRLMSDLRFLQRNLTNLSIKNVIEKRRFTDNLSRTNEEANRLFAL